MYFTYNHARYRLLLAYTYKTSLLFVQLPTIIRGRQCWLWTISRQRPNVTSRRLNSCRPTRCQSAGTQSSALTTQLAVNCGLSTLLATTQRRVLATDEWSLSVSYPPRRQWAIALCIQHLSETAAKCCVVWLRRKVNLLVFLLPANAVW